MIYDYSINRNIYRCIWALYFTCLDGELRTYRKHFASYLRNMIQSMRNVLHVTGRRWYNIPGTSFKVLEEAVTTCQERLASYLQKISQRIRNVLQVTWRRCYNVSGTSCKLLEEKFTTYQEGRASYLQVGRCCTYQERLAWYLTKILQHSRNIIKVPEEAVTTCHERLASYLQRNVLQVTWRRCYNVSGTSCKLLEEKLTTYQEGRASYLQVGRCCKYQERLAWYLTKILQHSRNIIKVGTSSRFLKKLWQRAMNVLQVTCRRFPQRIRNVLQVPWRRCYNVSGTSGKLLEEKLTTYQEGRARYLQVWRCCT